MSSEERLDELEEANELEDAEFANLSRRARRRVLEQQLGKRDYKQQLRDGMVSGGRRIASETVKAVRGVRVDSENVEKLFGLGGENSARLRDLGDPSKMRGR